MKHIDLKLSNLIGQFERTMVQIYILYKFFNKYRLMIEYR